MITWEYDKIIEVILNPANKYVVRVQLNDQSDENTTRTEFIKFDSYPTSEQIEAQAIVVCDALNTPNIEE